MTQGWGPPPPGYYAAPPLRPKKPFFTAGGCGCLAIVVFIAGAFFLRSRKKAEAPPTPSEPASAPYTVPAEVTLETNFERGPAGEIFVVGTTNLPNGTKLGFEVPVGGGQDYKVIVANGQFRSTGFTAKGSPLPAGPAKIQVLTRFNGAWQTPAVLQLVGKGGANLKGGVVKLEDPKLIDSDKIIDEVRSVTFPAISPEATAISLTKKAVLTVDGRRSSEDVEHTIELYLQNPEIKAGSWSAKQESGTKYVVSYGFTNGDAGAETAMWTVDLATKQVTYLNKYAKNFSWAPAD